MRPILVVAGGVFRDSIRERVAYGLVFFALMLMAASFLLAQITAGQDVKIIKDLGLAASSAIGLFIAVFFGIGLVTKEVERRSIYSLLSKPVTRAQFIVGKYLGLALTLLINLTVMVVAFYLVLAYLDATTVGSTKLAWEAPALDPQMLKAFALIGVELLVMTAVALFLSTFSSPFLSVALSIAIYIIGHFGEDLKNLDSLVESKFVAGLGRAVYYVLPNLERLDVKSAVVHAVPVSAEHVLLATLSSSLYIGVLLVASTIVFSRRDLK
jgi:ABC-type transport system involved in multi-copper enzyme maturation permease subunit